LRSCCAMGGEDVVGEVKGVDELGVRDACRGAQSRGERRSEIEAYIHMYTHTHTHTVFI